jgi:hypothetical protein
MYHVIILHVDDVMSHEESRHPNTNTKIWNAWLFLPLRWTPPVVAALGHALSSSSHKVQELTLTVDMRMHTTQVLFQGINSISGFHVSKICNFVADAIPVLATAFSENKRLKILQLDSCRLEDDEVAELVPA